MSATASPTPSSRPTGVTRRLARAALVALVAAGGLSTTVSAPPAGAATYEVTDASDNAATPNTLRWAVAQASADAVPPTITIAPGLHVDLTCAGGGALAYDSASDHALTIEGNGATVNQTCAGVEVLTTADEDLRLYGLTITGGQAGGVVGGGDVYVEGSTVEGNSGRPGITGYTGHTTIYRSTVQGNDGNAGGGVGATFVTVVDSTVSGNEATMGGGVWGDQWVDVVNSTITGNTASMQGGGVYAGLDDILLHHATVVGNTAPKGANVDLDSGAQLTGFASLLGEPLGGGENCELSPAASVVSHGANVSSDASCSLIGSEDDLDDTDPEVGALAANGGPTLTRLPAPTSPALDRAECQPLVVSADQRGVARPQGPRCDSGAVEVEPTEGGGGSTPDPSPGTATPAGPARPVPLTPRFTG